MEYYKRKGTRDFKAQILADFQTMFPGTRIPSKNMLMNIWQKKPMTKDTVNNYNSKTSPGDCHSRWPRTVRTEANTANVKAVMDRDAIKVNIVWLKFCQINWVLLKAVSNS